MALSSRQEKELRSLRRRRERQRRGRFLAEGVRVMEDLLASSVGVHEVFSASSLEDTERGRALLAQIRARPIGHTALTDQELATWASTETPQGVLAIAEIPRWEMADLLRGPAPSVVLVLDGVQDPGNLGTLIRTTEALGGAGVVALPGSVDFWNEKVVRAAAGSAFRLPLVSAPWEETREWLDVQGFRVLAADMDGDPVRGGAPRVALVVGNEGAGLSDEVRRQVDALVAVPLRGRAESLNVAAATAILMYELLS